MTSRVASLWLPSFTLQSWCKAHALPLSSPVALVREERLDAPIEALSPTLERCGIEVGMPLALAREHRPELRVACWSAAKRAQAVQEMVRSLQQFSPRVEAVAESEGAFWLDPSGMQKLYGGLRNWAKMVHAYLRGRGYRYVMVLGFQPHPSLAIAQGERRSSLLRSADEEHLRTCALPLARLAIDPELRKGLCDLGIQRLGQVFELPRDALARRFGQAAATLCDRFQHVLPVQGEIAEPSFQRQVHLDYGEKDSERLLFLFKRLYDPLSQSLRRQGKAPASFTLTLGLEAHPDLHLSLETARPTHEGTLWFELLRLRLGTLELPSGVVRLQLEAHASPVEPEQLQTLACAPARDLAAGERALARLRAAFGEESVCRARLHEAHLPEAGFRWESLKHLQNQSASKARAASPKRHGRGHRSKEDRQEAQRSLELSTSKPGLQKCAQVSEAPSLIRRFLARPRRLAWESKQLCFDPQALAAPGQLAPLALESLAPEQIRAAAGPYRVDGAWWAKRVSRDYYYVLSENQDLLWVFFDHRRNAWYLQAYVD